MPKDIQLARRIRGETSEVVKSSKWVAFLKVEDVFINGNVLYELNTSEYSNGLFQIEIQTEESTEVKKLIVSH